MPFTNPVIAGLTLIRTAIHSPDYVAGVSGWSINKDGTAEFNDATIRGELIAGGGTVVLNSGGLRIEGSNNQFDINAAAGFIARRKPDDGTFAFLNVFDDPSSLGGYVALQPENPTPINGNTYTNCAFVYVDTTEVGSTDFGTLLFQSPYFLGKARALITMYSQGSDSVADNSEIILDAETVTTTGLAVIGPSGTNGWQSYTPSWTGSVTNPVINNGTIVGRYIVMNNTCTFNINITMGGTTTFGSGAYAFTLPVAPANQSSCSAFCQDSSAGLRAGGAGLLTAGSGIFRVVVRGNAVDSAAAGISSASPWAWASGDTITISGSYEV